MGQHLAAARPVPQGLLCGFHSPNIRAVEDVHLKRLKIRTRQDITRRNDSSAYGKYLIKYMPFFRLLRGSYMSWGPLIGPISVQQFVRPGNGEHSIYFLA